MDVQKENVLDRRKEFDWIREFMLEDDTLPQKQVIVSTILAALSGLRTALSNSELLPDTQIPP